MIKASEQVILMADSTKYNQVCFQQFGTLKQVDVLIMDNNLAPYEQDTLVKLVNEVYMA